MIVVENIEKVQLVNYLTSLICAVFIVKNLLTKNDGNIFRPEIYSECLIHRKEWLEGLCKSSYGVIYLD